MYNKLGTRDYNRPLKIKITCDEDGYTAKLSQTPKDFYKKLPYGFAETIEGAIQDLKSELASLGINRELKYL